MFSLTTTFTCSFSTTGMLQERRESVLTKSKYIFLKNPENLTEKQALKLSKCYQIRSLFDIVQIATVCIPSMNAVFRFFLFLPIEFEVIAYL